MSTLRLMISALCIIALPLAAHADVFISEIAWMGTSNGGSAAADAADEWIELVNEGSTPVDLSGWMLAAADGVPSISLSGTIQPGAYFLIERTDDASAAPQADLTPSFGSGLSNEGETLRLSDASGVVVHEVVGASGWKSIGGSSTTKHTPQRSGGGWIVAAPTPKATNATAAASTESAPSTSTSATSADTVPSSPVPRLYIETGGDRVVSTHAHTSYRALVYDADGRVRTDAAVTWTFGDGTKKRGPIVRHAYGVPGEYAVVVRAESKRRSDTTLFTTTVEDALIRIKENTDVGIALMNESARTLDLSWWQLRAGDDVFGIPRDTNILPGRTVWFRHSVTGLSTSTPVSLEYPSRQVAVTFEGVQLSGSPDGIQEMKDIPYGEHIIAPVTPTDAGVTGAVSTGIVTP